jgi:hypothetical protein
MRYYTYKITFKDLPCYFYYGKHKNKGKPYYGSPVTWRHLWDQFEPEVQILQWYETAEEARLAEEAIIKCTWGNKYSLNENWGGCFSEEVCKRNGKKISAFGLSFITPQILSENGKKNMTPEKARGYGKRNMTPEKARGYGKANGKESCGQRWKCLVTGYVSNPGGLSAYQKSRGIDTSLRAKVEE